MFVLIFVKSYENGFSIENSYQTALYESREEAVKAMKESAEKHVNSYLETEDDERVEFTEYGDLGEKGLGQLVLGRFRRLLVAGSDKDIGILVVHPVYGRLR